MISKGNDVKFARFVLLASATKQKYDFQVFFVDRARHRENIWRQGLTRHKKVDKEAKEPFADYMKEKKLIEPEVFLHV